MNTEQGLIQNCHLDCSAMDVDSVKVNTSLISSLNDEKMFCISEDRGRKRGGGNSRPSRRPDGTYPSCPICLLDNPICGLARQSYLLARQPFLLARQAYLLARQPYLLVG